MSTTATTMSTEVVNPPVKCLWKLKTELLRLVIVARVKDLRVNRLSVIKIL